MLTKTSYLSKDYARLYVPMAHFSYLLSLLIIIVVTPIF